MSGTDETRGGRRLPVLQALIVFAIAGLVAALAIPALAGQAKDSVLRQNQAMLALKLRAQLVLALEEAPLPSASPSVAEDSPEPLAASLQRLLRKEATNDFVNPYSGSSAIACVPSLPADAIGRPAVWITDDARYGFEQFRSSAGTKMSLAGSLVVACRESKGTTFEVYYVDAEGQASPSVEVLRLDR